MLDIEKLIGQLYNVKYLMRLGFFPAGNFFYHDATFRVEDAVWSRIFQIEHAVWSHIKHETRTPAKPLWKNSKGWLTVRKNG